MTKDKNLSKIINGIELYINKIMKLLEPLEGKQEGLITIMNKMLDNIPVRCNDCELAFLMSRSVYDRYLWVTSKPDSEPLTYSWVAPKLYPEPLTFKGIKILKDASLKDGQIYLTRVIEQSIYEEEK